jgi:hypothetical protein
MSHIWLYDLDCDLEDCDKVAVQLHMRKYAKLWRNIFSKYSNAGFRIAPLHERGSFEGLKQADEQITLPEVTKLLRDHNSYPTIVSRDDLAQLFRLIQIKHGVNASNQTIDYARYQQLIL